MMLPLQNILKLYFQAIIFTTIIFGVCFTKPAALSSASNDKSIPLPDYTLSNVSANVNVNEIKSFGADNNMITLTDEERDYRKSYAAQMLTYMNETVSPCDDFYEYACGNWKNTIAEKQSLTKRNNLLDIRYKLAEIVQQILTRASIDDLAPEYSDYFQLAKKFYNNCLTAELLPFQKSEDYLKILQNIGGFPAVDANWKPDNFHWLNMSAHMSNYGSPNFVKEKILPQYPFSLYYRLPSFGFDIELHHDNLEASSNARQLNTKRIKDILQLYGVADDHIDKITKNIFEFLQSILEVTKEFEEDTDQCEAEISSLSESELDAIKLQWESYQEITKLTGNECCPPCYYFYHKLSNIVESNKEAAANYLSLKFLYHLDAKLKDKDHQTDYCVMNIWHSMIFLVDHIYMKIHFNDEIRDEITTIVKELRQSLRTVLEEADWLDEPTREAALKKESLIAEYVGRYENKEMIKSLINEMKNLTFIENASYEANYLNLMKFKKYMARFNGIHFEELDNSTKPLMILIGLQVNAFYYNIDNAIYVMAGILQPPSYHKTWPNSLKYGTLGYLVGHEFTHGFDSTGSEFDSEGLENNWWSNKSGKVFNDRSNCFVNHYQNYVIPEIKRNINGNLTKDENIADGGGLREALLAYRRYMKKLSNNVETISSLYKQEQMPGLDLTPEQLFFLGFAQLWCSSYKEAHYWEELDDEHTIDKYRVLGAVSNNADFAKAYDCKMGSRMNPAKDKCEVW